MTPPADKREKLNLRIFQVYLVLMGACILAILWIAFR